MAVLEHDCHFPHHSLAIPTQTRLQGEVYRRISLTAAGEPPIRPDGTQEQDLDTFLMYQTLFFDRVKTML